MVVPCTQGTTEFLASCDAMLSLGFGIWDSGLMVIGTNYYLYFLSARSWHRGLLGCREVTEREEAPLALRAARSHTVGYVGGCAKEQWGIE